VNYGPLIFLAAFLGMAGSWIGLVLAPQIQLGSLQATNKVGAVTYPVDRPGLAKAGLEVYRANGCAYCHSQQIGQTGTEFEIVLGNAGTNQAAVLAALQKLRPVVAEAELSKMLSVLPVTVLRLGERVKADSAVKALTGAGGKAALGVKPLGPDIARGWGNRRTVADDFLYDQPVMPGLQRIGPDLANVGLRLPDPNWHLRHLYLPRSEVKGSTMPLYPFLFEKRKIGSSPDPDALVLSGPVAPPAGYEIVPKPEARALVAYLLNLRADVSLFSAPLASAVVSGGGSGTNAAPGLGAPTNGVPAK
jgi:cbb3-type cytochrome oxidase cytochrome c subunit